MHPSAPIFFMCVFTAKLFTAGREGPWVWLAYRAGRCHFSSQIFAPCFLTFAHVHRVYSTLKPVKFEGGIGAPDFSASGRAIGRVMRERDARA